MCHQAVEKILKGYYSFTIKKIPPAKEFSDIDVAIVVEKIENGFLESKFFLYKLVRNFDLRIEPVLFEEGKDPSGFLEEIDKTGIIIYKKNNLKGLPCTIR